MNIYLIVELFKVILQDKLKLLYIIEIVSHISFGVHNDSILVPLL